MSGDALVDSVRFTVTNADQSQTILVFYVPVQFRFGADAVYNIQVTPFFPSSIEFGRYVHISFNYDVSTPGGVRIFPRPFTNGNLTPIYGASASDVYTGTGTETGAFFTIYSGTTNVDHIRFRVTDADQNEVLNEFLVPVGFTYAAHAISNITITPSFREGLLHNENVNVGFSYHTTEPSGVVIFVRPFTDGDLSPHYAAHASPTYATGSGSGTGYFTVTSGMVNVDSVRFRMLNASQSEVLLDYFVPVNFHFGTAKMSNVGFKPTSPAYFTNNEPDTVSYAYDHSNSSGALMWAIPQTQGNFSPFYSYRGSPVVASGSGNHTRDFSITEGSVKVDAVNLLMRNPDQTETYVDWDVPVDFYFGSQAVTTINEVPESPLTFALEQNYPNPFNPRTVVSSQLPVASNVKLVVYNILGQEVAILVNGRRAAGSYQDTFDASNLASGVYVYRLVAGDFVASKRMVLVK
jgi:hypothetical protein